MLMMLLEERVIKPLVTADTLTTAIFLVCAAVVLCLVVEMHNRIAFSQSKKIEPLTHEELEKVRQDEDKDMNAWLQQWEVEGGDIVYPRYQPGRKLSRYASGFSNTSVLWRH